MNFKEALEKLREEKKRKFDQSVDLVVNLKGIDVKRDNIATVINIPHKIKEKKVCGFFSEKNSLVKCVLEPEFSKYRDGNALKKLVREYDFFIAEAKLMPKVAATFGKALGPVGKMPSPQLGILPKVEDAAVKTLLARIDKAVKLRLKEASIKVSIGREKMKDEEILANVDAVYNGIVNALPNKKENVKNVLIKFSMSKPLKVEAK